MTKQRQLVFDTIVNSPYHLTAEQIYTIAKEQMPSIAVGTVYRNLGILTDERYIRKIEIAGGPDRYDKNLSPHEHMICDICGNVSDVCDCSINDILCNITDNTMTSYELTIHYVCEDCRSIHNNITSCKN